MPYEGGKERRLDSRVERDSLRTAGDRRLDGGMSRRWDKLLIYLATLLTARSSGN
jgi:hypothetical protein